MGRICGPRFLIQLCELCALCVSVVHRAQRSPRHWAIFTSNGLAGNPAESYSVQTGLSAQQ